MHRLEAESARGGTPAGVGADFAVDGIDEFLCTVHARPRSAVHRAEPRTLRVRATDTPGTLWTVRLSAGPPVTSRTGTGAADCELAGPAASLYAALWNRRPFPDVTGAPSLAALWREKSGVTWD